MAVLSRLCGGKVNLFLKVERLNQDGFHDIATLFVPFECPADRITLTTGGASGIKVRSSDPALPQDGKNLAGIAAKLYADAAEITPDWEIFIEKSLPVSGGVGGGSANAAKTLLLLNGHYRKLTETQLAEIAFAVGSDVPFFLLDTPAVGRGRGEKLTPAEFPAPPLLLVEPGFPVSAKWAYTHLDPARKTPADDNRIRQLISALADRNYHRAAELMHNDLEYALFEKFPLLEVIKNSLISCGALRVMVSGSGSSVLALFDSCDEARRAKKEFSALMPLKCSLLEGEV